MGRVLSGVHVSERGKLLWDLAERATVEVAPWPEWYRRAVDEALVTKLEDEGVMSPLEKLERVYALREAAKAMLREADELYESMTPRERLRAGLEHNARRFERIQRVMMDWNEPAASPAATTAKPEGTCWNEPIPEGKECWTLYPCFQEAAQGPDRKQAEVSMSDRRETMDKRLILAEGEQPSKNWAIREVEQQNRRIGAAVVLREMAAELDDMTQYSGGEHSDGLHDAIARLEEKARELEGDAREESSDG